jgi:hypothetical protein
MIAQYLVHKTKSKTNDAQVGPTHLGDAEKTLCGIALDELWWIEGEYVAYGDASSQGLAERGLSQLVTCKKCAKAYGDVQG